MRPENTVWKISQLVCLTKYYSGEQIKDNEVSREWDIGNAYKILVGKPEGKNNSKNLEVDESIILKWM